MRDAREWAEREFGGAQLGDRRRTQRLVRMAAEVASKPAGVVSKACRSSASREGAFRLLESSDVHVEAVRGAVETAAMGRCSGERRVVVPIDGTSLTISDWRDVKGLGAVGAWDKGARGLHVMTAMALTPLGAPIGICGQHMWIRQTRSPHGRHGARGKQSENDVWLDLLVRAHRGLAEQAPGCTPWFQMDRGADCWHVLALAHALGLLMTVRAAHDRRVDANGQLLWETVEGTATRAKLHVQVPERPPLRRKKRFGSRRITCATKRRPARTAKLSIRAAAVDVHCPHRDRSVHLNAVLVREDRRGDERIEWMLLTTHPIRTRRDGLDIVRGYTLRWRIEEFHRVWKRGLCRVEDTQLRSCQAILKWATVLAAVATRAMRLTQLARSAPDALASTEFSSTELQALVALREPKGTHELATLSLALAVRWVADLGGYSGPWKGPPGATIIGRGLYDVLVAARAFENSNKKR